MDKWLREFILLVTLSAMLSGIAYYVQNTYFSDFTLDIWNTTQLVIRMLRMLLIYVIPVLIFQRRHNGRIGELGVLPSRKYPISSLFGGISIYLIAVYVFIKYKIFFAGWIYLPINVVWQKLILIGIMASITDFWTRGFILLELQKRYGDGIAIFWQNVIWFTLHLYEIELLQPSIGYAGAILLTLILGVGGDMIAIKTKSITGLMLGHIILNICIAFAARDALFFI